MNQQFGLGEMYHGQLVDLLDEALDGVGDFLILCGLEPDSSADSVGWDGEIPADRAA